ncbi:MAG TPA: hypothetical protein VIJ27_13190, partial [Mucilaginibacter sp.]
VAELEIIGSENVLISSVSVMELYRGMQNKKEMTEMQKKISRYNIYILMKLFLKSQLNWLINLSYPTIYKYRML